MRYNNNRLTNEPDEEDKNLQYEFQEAIRKADIEAVNYLLKNSKIDVNQPFWDTSGNPALLEAADTGNAALIKLLCETGCDPNVRSMRGQTALHVALSSRRLNVESISILLESGCNANVQENLRGETALHTFLNKHIIAASSSAKKKNCWSDFKNDISYSFAMVTKYTDVNKVDHRRRTLLHMIASAKFDTSTLIILVQILLDHNADLNVQNARGETPLHEALENNNTDIAVMLIKSKTDLRLATNYHETSLHIAARKNMREIVLMLLDHNSPVNNEDLDGNTALHLAASRGYKEVVQLLLQNEDIKINLSNKEGLTPLHLAVESGFIYVVEMLLKAESCDLNARTKRCETALDLAQQDYRRRSQPEMTEVISRELQRRSNGKLM